MSADVPRAEAERGGEGPPVLDLDLDVPCTAWRDRIGDLEPLVDRAVRAAFLSQSEPLATTAIEVSVVLSDDASVTELNRDWRGQDKPTNVLSFPSGASPDGLLPFIVGDVVLAFETVAAEAERDGKPFDAHLTHLIVHGCLHLLGHDHQIDEEAEAMEALETHLLGALGYADPYAERADQDG